MCMFPGGCCLPHHGVPAEASRGSRAWGAPRARGCVPPTRLRVFLRATEADTDMDMDGLDLPVSSAAPGSPALLEGRRAGLSGSGSSGGERRVRARLPLVAFSAGQRPLPYGHPPVPQAGEARSPLPAHGAGGSGRAGERRRSCMEREGSEVPVRIQRGSGSSRGILTNFFTFFLENTHRNRPTDCAPLGREPL